jgi:hypothetical protein
MRNLTFEIEATDCVGDSVGKHNYNILSIDTANCNLSSECFLGPNSVLTWFNDLSSTFNNLNWMYTNFSNASMSAYQINHQIITTLSSYWHTPEFTVMYEYNNYSLDGNSNNAYPDNLTFNAHFSSAAINDFNTLSGQLKMYLSNNFPASTFNLNTRANVVTPIFTLTMNPTGNVVGSVYVPINGQDYVYPDNVVNNAVGQAKINANAVAALASTAIGSNTSYNNDYNLHQVYASQQGNLGTISPSSSYNRTIKIKYNQNNVYTKNLYTVKFIAAIDPIYNVPTWKVYNAILN